jgi:HEAT repeat protein
MGQVESDEIDNGSKSVTLEAEDPRRRVGQLVNLLVRVFDTSMADGEEEGPALKRLRKELLKSLEEFLEEATSFPLEIRPFELLWHGWSVYENRAPEGLPNTLHRGGLKQLDFSPGITDPELSQFFDLIRDTRSQEKEAEDLVTLLQDGDFPHVKSVVNDDFLETHPLPIPESLDDFRRLYPREVTPVARQSKNLREYYTDSESDFLEPFPEGYESTPNRFRNLNQLHRTTPQEIEAVDSEIRHESAAAFDRHGVENLIEVLLGEKSKKEFEKIVRFVLGILDDSLKSGDYKGAREVLKKLYLSFHVSSLNGWQKKRIKKGIIDAGNESRIGSIAERMKNQEGLDLQDLARYVSLLQRNAVPHLCRLLGELKGSKRRRIICDALADIGKNSIGVFGAFLDDDRWFVVRNIVYVLGRIEKPECLPYLEKALDHPDPRVRREAVQATSTAASVEAAIMHLTRKLNDMDGKIRGIAALRLAKIGGEEALRSLLDLVLSKAFQKREIQEIKLFLQALGILGSDGAVPALLRILLKKSFFGKVKTDEIRRGAADALGVIGTDEAIIALKKAGTIGDELAREASSAVLRRVGER